MAIAYRSIASTTLVARTNTTVNKPTGTAENDILIAGIHTESDVSVTAPAGWTLIADVDHTTIDQDWKIYWLRAGASEGSSYTWTHNNAYSCGVILAISGAATSGDPQDATVGTDNDDFGTTSTYPSITTATNGSLLVGLSTAYNTSAYSSVPSGWTEHLDSAGMQVITKLQTTAGATGSTSSTNEGTSFFCVAVIAIKEASSGGSDSLTASNVTTVAPSVAAPTLTQSHVLTGLGVTSGNPTPSVVAINQIHALIATSPTTGPPTLQNTSIGQTHVLSGSALTAGAPVISPAILGSIHALVASTIVTASPALSTTDLAQVHVLSAVAITTNPPVLDSPSMSGETALGSIGITTGNAVVGTATLSQQHTLSAQNVNSGNPYCDVVEIGVIHNLVAGSVITAVPTIEQTNLGISGALNPLSILTGQPVVDSSEVGQVHKLSSVDITTNNVSIASATLQIIHALVADGVTSGAAFTDGSSLGQIHVLTSVDIVSAPVLLAQSSLGQLHNLATSILLSGQPSLGSTSLNLAARPITDRTTVVDFQGRLAIVSDSIRIRIVE